MPTFTPNFNFAKPTISGDVDTWGGLLNGNFDTIDTQLQTALTGASLTAVNVGAGTGLFESKTANQLRFKSLQPAATTNTTITSDADEVFIGRTDEQTDVRGNLRHTPNVVQNTGITLGAAQYGCKILKTGATAFTVTIPPGLDNGAAFVLRNQNAAGAITVARGAGVVLRQAGTASDVNATLAPWGEALLHHEGSNVYVISGTGIS